MSEKMKVGIIGCGNISQAYFNGAKVFDNVEIAACADINTKAAQAKAAENNVRAVEVEDMLKDPEIGIVVNLTLPKVHAEVSVKALEAGKHVHCEKPLAVNRLEGRMVLDVAARKGLRVGCAPDTFLGAGYQTCRKVIDDGWIGRPVAGTAFMMCHGHESWHPNPMFYYEKGGGPMFDMGPYYLTALVHLLGPVKAVSASVAVSFPERIATSKEQVGRRIKVEVPTHLAGTLEFHGGAIVSIVMSFDVHRHGHSPIEIYGSEGTLHAPDPNGFGGPVRIFRAGNENWSDLPLTHGYASNTRGIGMADMAKGIQSGRAHRCSGELACHVLDVMQAFEESSDSRRHVAIESRCDRPKAFPTGMIPGSLDS